MCKGEVFHALYISFLGDSENPVLSIRINRKPKESKNYNFLF